MKENEKIVLGLGAGIGLAWLLFRGKKTITTNALLHFLPDQNNIGYGMTDSTGVEIVVGGTRLPQDVTLLAGIYNVRVVGGDSWSPNNPM